MATDPTEAWLANLAAPDVTNSPPQTPSQSAEIVAPGDVSSQPEKPSGGLYKGFEDSLAYDTVLGWMVSHAASREFEPDPDFSLDTTKLETLGKDIPMEYWGEFNKAQSQAEAESLRRRLLYRIQAEKNLQEMGYKGIGIRMATQLLDVPTMVASAIVGNVAGGGAVTTAKAGRLMRIVKAGMAASAVDGASQAYIYSQDPLGDPKTILYSAILGGVTGGAGQVFSHTNPATKTLAKEIEQSDIKEAGLNITPKGERYFSTLPNAEGNAVSSYLDTVFKVEGSGKNPRSTAAGPFQFLDSTWLEYAKKSKNPLVEGKTRDEILALKTDPSAEAQAFLRDRAEAFTKDNLEQLHHAGLAATEGDLYMAHFLGAGDAVKVLTADPDAPIAGLLPAKVLSSNPDVFRHIKTAADLKEWAYDAYARQAGKPQTAFAHARLDMTGTLKRDAENAPEWADIGNYLAEDSVGNLDHSPLAPTISHEASMLRESTLGDFLRTSNRVYEDEATARGFNWLKRVGDIGRTDIMEEAGLVARGVQQSTSKALDDVVEKWRQISASLLQQAKKAGVKGFEDIPENEGYVPRIWRADKISKAVAQFGDTEVKATISEALARGLGLNLKEAQAVIRTSWRNIRQRDLGHETQLSMLLDGRNKDALVKQLADHGVEKDIIDSIASKLEVKPDGTSPRAKHRMQLDESYVSPRTGLKVTDLLENDLERLAINYTQHMSGNIAFAKFGFENRAAFDSTVRKAVDASVERGHLTDFQIRHRESIARTLANSIMGVPNTQPTMLNVLGQQLMQYNYIRLGGGFGFASLPETMEILATTGVRNFIQGMPAIGKVFRSLKDGKDIDLAFIRELESMGVAQDMVMARAFSRYDMWDGLIEPHTSTQFLNATSRIFNTGRKITGIASGLAPLTRVQQLWAGQSILQNLARGAEGINAKRLALMGLSPRDAKLIQEQLQKHASFEAGLLGRKVKSINLDKFDDEAVADKLRMAVVRYVNRAIQKQDVGELPEMLVSSTMARLFAQFKIFGIVAWSKKTLAGIHLHDTQTALSVGLTSLMGTLVYAGQTYLNSLTKDDPQDYRDKRLSMGNLIKAGIQRAGFSSMIPQAVDTATMIASGGKQSFFNPYARTSGLPLDFWNGNPTVQLGSNIKNALSIPYKLYADDTQFSKDDLQTIRNLLPWSTMVGASQLYDAMGANLPNHSETSY